LGCPVPHISPLFERVLANRIVRLFNDSAKTTTGVGLFTLQNVAGVRMLVDSVIAGHAASEK
jgi:hypothetical protein